MTPFDLVADDANRFTIAERVHAGVATVSSETKGQSLSFVTDGWLRIDDYGWVGLRLPVVAGSVAQPAGSYIDEAAWGNPEVRTAIPVMLVDEHRQKLRLTLGGGVGAPLAEHAPSPLPDRALAIANGIEGLAEPELFRPRSLPVTPFLQLDAVRRRLSASATLKVPVLAGVSERGLRVAVVLQTEGTVAITRGFGLSLAPQVVMDGSPVQLLLRGGPFFGISDWGRIAVDVQAPIGGSLGGSTVGAGVRLGVTR